MQPDEVSVFLGSPVEKGTADVNRRTNDVEGSSLDLSNGPQVIIKKTLMRGSQRDGGRERKSEGTELREGDRGNGEEQRAQRKEDRGRCRDGWGQRETGKERGRECEGQRE